MTAQSYDNCPARLRAAFWQWLLDKPELWGMYYQVVRRLQDPREQAVVAARQHAVPSPLLAQLKGEQA